MIYAPRHADRGVFCTDFTGSGWVDAEVTGLSISEFVRAVDEETFNPYAG